MSDASNLPLPFAGRKAIPANGYSAPRTGANPAEPEPLLIMNASASNPRVHLCTPSRDSRTTGRVRPHNLKFPYF